MDEDLGSQTIPAEGAPTPAADAVPAGPPDAPATGPRPPYWRWAAIAVALVAVAVGAFFVGRAAGDEEAGAVTTTAAATSTAATTGATIGASEEPVADVAAVLAPSVVQIETRRGLGSGVIYDSDGYILTAAHVVERANGVTVRLADGTRLDGTVVGADPSSDVAVVKVEEAGLPAAAIDPGVEVRVGQLAIAIGSPWGLDQTVTAGIVSSAARTVTGPDGVARTMIQTDAPINPGNSGGALADRHGRVIGINDAIYSLSGGSDGVGFAIPIDTALSVAERLVAGEEIRPALLGVRGTDTTSGPAGALISGVVPGSPADEAGLRVGDVITRFDGRIIESFADLAAAVQASRPGETVTLTVQRGDDEITLEASLAERNGE